MERLTGTHDQDGDWVISPPDAEGMSAHVLGGLAQQFEDWDEANLHAALIVRRGKLIYERYFTGEDKAWATPLIPRRPPA